MRRALWLLLLLPTPALAETISWDPVTGATAYEVEQSINDGGAWTKVGADVLPTACTGTPVRCAVVVTPPASGLTIYRITAKDATRRTTTLDKGPWINKSWTQLAGPGGPGVN